MEQAESSSGQKEGAEPAKLGVEAERDARAQLPRLDLRDVHAALAALQPKPSPGPDTTPAIDDGLCAEAAAWFSKARLRRFAACLEKAPFLWHADHLACKKTSIRGLAYVKLLELLGEPAKRKSCVPRAVSLCRVFIARLKEQLQRAAEKSQARGKGLEDALELCPPWARHANSYLQLLPEMFARLHPAQSAPTEDQKNTTIASTAPCPYDFDSDSEQPETSKKNAKKQTRKYTKKRKGNQKNKSVPSTATVVNTAGDQETEIDTDLRNFATNIMGALKDPCDNDFGSDQDAEINVELRKTHIATVSRTPPVNQDKNPDSKTETLITNISTPPFVDDNSHKPCVNDNSHKPSVNDYSHIPCVNDNNHKPSVNDYSHIPCVNDNNHRPSVNDNSHNKHETLITNISTSPFVDDNSHKPCVNDNNHNKHEAITTNISTVPCVENSGNDHQTFVTNKSTPPCVDDNSHNQNENVTTNVSTPPCFIDDNIDNSDNNSETIPDYCTNASLPACGNDHSEDESETNITNPTAPYIQNGNSDKESEINVTKPTSPCVNDEIKDPEASTLPCVEDEIIHHESQEITPKTLSDLEKISNLNSDIGLKADVVNVSTVTCAGNDISDREIETIADNECMVPRDTEHSNKEIEANIENVSTVSCATYDKSDKENEANVVNVSTVTCAGNDSNDREDETIADNECTVPCDTEHSNKEIETNIENMSTVSCATYDKSDKENEANVVNVSTVTCAGNDNNDREDETIADNECTVPRDTEHSNKEIEANIENVSTVSCATYDKSDKENEANVVNVSTVTCAGNDNNDREDETIADNECMVPRNTEHSNKEIETNIENVSTVSCATYDKSDKENEANVVNVSTVTCAGNDSNDREDETIADNQCMVPRNTEHSNKEIETNIENVSMVSCATYEKSDKENEANVVNVSTVTCAGNDNNDRENEANVVNVSTVTYAGNGNNDRENETIADYECMVPRDTEHSNKEIETNIENVSTVSCATYDKSDKENEANVVNVSTVTYAGNDRENETIADSECMVPRNTEHSNKEIETNIENVSTVSCATYDKSDKENEPIIENVIVAPCDILSSDNENEWTESAVDPLQEDPSGDEPGSKKSVTQLCGALLRRWIELQDETKSRLRGHLRVHTSRSAEETVFAVDGSDEEQSNNDAVVDDEICDDPTTDDDREFQAVFNKLKTALMMVQDKDDVAVGLPAKELEGIERDENEPVQRFQTRDITVSNHITIDSKTSNCDDGKSKSIAKEKNIITGNQPDAGVDKEKDLAQQSLIRDDVLTIDGVPEQEIDNKISRKQVKKKKSKMKVEFLAKKKKIYSKRDKIHSKSKKVPEKQEIAVGLPAKEVEGIEKDENEPVQRFQTRDITVSNHITIDSKTSNCDDGKSKSIAKDKNIITANKPDAGVDKDKDLVQHSLIRDVLTINGVPEQEIDNKHPRKQVKEKKSKMKVEFLAKKKNISSKRDKIHSKSKKVPEKQEIDEASSIKHVKKLNSMSKVDLVARKKTSCSKRQKIHVKSGKNCEQDNGEGNSRKQPHTKDKKPKYKQKICSKRQKVYEGEMLHQNKPKHKTICDHDHNNKKHRKKHLDKKLKNAIELVIKNIEALQLSNVVSEEQGLLQQHHSKDTVISDVPEQSINENLIKLAVKENIGTSRGDEKTGVVRIRNYLFRRTHLKDMVFDQELEHFSENDDNGKSSSVMSDETFSTNTKSDLRKDSFDTIDDVKEGVVDVYVLVPSPESNVKQHKVIHGPWPEVNIFEELRVDENVTGLKSNIVGEQQGKDDAQNPPLNILQDNEVDESTASPEPNKKILNKELRKIDHSDIVTMANFDGDDENAGLENPKEIYGVNDKSSNKQNTSDNLSQSTKQNDYQTVGKYSLENKHSKVITSRRTISYLTKQNQKTISTENFTTLQRHNRGINVNNIIRTHAPYKGKRRKCIYTKRKRKRSISSQSHDAANENDTSDCSDNIAINKRDQTKGNEQEKIDNSDGVNVHMSCQNNFSDCLDNNATNESDHGEDTEAEKSVNNDAGGVDMSRRSRCNSANAGLGDADVTEAAFDPKLHMQPVVVLKKLTNRNIDNYNSLRHKPRSPPTQTSSNASSRRFSGPKSVKNKRVWKISSNSNEVKSEDIVKRVKLPDIEEVRRKNRRMLTAQVTPITHQIGPVSAVCEHVKSTNISTASAASPLDSCSRCTAQRLSASPEGAEAKPRRGAAARARSFITSYAAMQQHRKRKRHGYLLIESASSDDASPAVNEDSVRTTSMSHCLKKRRGSTRVRSVSSDGAIAVVNVDVVPTDVPRTSPESHCHKKRIQSSDDESYVVDVVSTRELITFEDEENTENDPTSLNLAAQSLPPNKATSDQNEGSPKQELARVQNARDTPRLQSVAATHTASISSSLIVNEDIPTQDLTVQSEKETDTYRRLKCATDVTASSPKAAHSDLKAVVPTQALTEIQKKQEEKTSVKPVKTGVTPRRKRKRRGGRRFTSPKDTSSILDETEPPPDVITSENEEDTTSSSKPAGNSDSVSAIVAHFDQNEGLARNDQDAINSLKRIISSLSDASALNEDAATQDLITIQKEQNTHCRKRKRQSCPRFKSPDDASSVPDVCEPTRDLSLEDKQNTIKPVIHSPPSPRSRPSPAKAASSVIGKRVSYVCKNIRDLITFEDDETTSLPALSDAAVSALNKREITRELTTIRSIRKTDVHPSPKRVKRFASVSSDGDIIPNEGSTPDPTTALNIDRSTELITQSVSTSPDPTDPNKNVPTGELTTSQNDQPTTASKQISRIASVPSSPAPFLSDDDTTMQAHECSDSDSISYGEPFILNDDDSQDFTIINPVQSVLNKNTFAKLDFNRLTHVPFIPNATILATQDDVVKSLKKTTLKTQSITQDDIVKALKGTIMTTQNVNVRKGPVLATQEDVVEARKGTVLDAKDNVAQVLKSPVPTTQDDVLKTRKDDVVKALKSSIPTTQDIVIVRKSPVSATQKNVVKPPKRTVLTTQNDVVKALKGTVLATKDNVAKALKDPVPTTQDDLVKTRKSTVLVTQDYVVKTLKGTVPTAKDIVIVRKRPVLATDIVKPPKHTAPTTQEEVAKALKGTILATKNTVVETFKGPVPTTQDDIVKTRKGTILATQHDVVKALKGSVPTTQDIVIVRKEPILATQIDVVKPPKHTVLTSQEDVAKGLKDTVLATKDTVVETFKGPVPTTQDDIVKAGTVLVTQDDLVKALKGTVLATKDNISKALKGPVLTTQDDIVKARKGTALATQDEIVEVQKGTTLTTQDDVAKALRERRKSSDCNRDPIISALHSPVKRQNTSKLGFKPLLYRQKPVPSSSLLKENAVGLAQDEQETCTYFNDRQNEVECSKTVEDDDNWIDSEMENDGNWIDSEIEKDPTSSIAQPLTEDNSADMIGVPFSEAVSDIHNSDVPNIGGEFDIQDMDAPGEFCPVIVSVRSLAPQQELTNESNLQAQTTTVQPNPIITSKQAEPIYLTSDNVQQLTPDDLTDNSAVSTDSPKVVACDIRVPSAQINPSKDLSGAPVSGSKDKSPLTVITLKRAKTSTPVRVINPTNSSSDVQDLPSDSPGGSQKVTHLREIVTLKKVSLPPHVQKQMNVRLISILKPPRLIEALSESQITTASSSLQFRKILPKVISVSDIQPSKQTNPSNVATVAPKSKPSNLPKITLKRAEPVYASYQNSFQSFRHMEEVQEETNLPRVVDVTGDLHVMQPDNQMGLHLVVSQPEVTSDVSFSNINQIHIDGQRDDQIGLQYVVSQEHASTYNSLPNTNQVNTEEAVIRSDDQIGLINVVDVSTSNDNSITNINRLEIDETVIQPDDERGEYLVIPPESTEDSSANINQNDKNDTVMRPDDLATLTLICREQIAPDDRAPIHPKDIAENSNNPTKTLNVIPLPGRIVRKRRPSVPMLVRSVMSGRRDSLKVKEANPTGAITARELAMIEQSCTTNYRTVEDWLSSGCAATIPSALWARDRPQDSLVLLCVGPAVWATRGPRPYLLLSERAPPPPVFALWTVSPRQGLELPDAESYSLASPPRKVVDDVAYQNVSDDPVRYAKLLVAVPDARACRELLQAGAPLQLYCLQTCQLYPLRAESLRDPPRFLLTGDAAVAEALFALKRELSQLGPFYAPLTSPPLLSTPVPASTDTAVNDTPDHTPGPSSSHNNTTLSSDAFTPVITDYNTPDLTGPGHSNTPNTTTLTSDTFSYHNTAVTTLATCDPVPSTSSATSRPPSPVNSRPATPTGPDSRPPTPNSPASHCSVSTVTALSRPSTPSTLSVLSPDISPVLSPNPRSTHSPGPFPGGSKARSAPKPSTSSRQSSKRKTRKCTQPDWAVASFARRSPGAPSRRWQAAPAQFLQQYRLPKDRVQALVDELRPLLPPMELGDMEPDEKVLTCLSFLASGSSPGSVSACAAVAQVTDALTQDEIYKAYVRFPEKPKERADIKHRFYEQYRLPGVLGAMAALHVPVMEPGEDEQDYFNGVFHSINVQVICDADGRILSADCGHGGGTHSCAAWLDHQLNYHLKFLRKRGEKVCLLGDASYPQQESTLTPVAAPAARMDALYNAAHGQAHGVVAECVDALRTRWRCLSWASETTAPTQVVAATLVGACAVLHNIAKDVPLPVDEEFTRAERRLSSSVAAAQGSAARYLASRRGAQHHAGRQLERGDIARRDVAKQLDKELRNPNRPEANLPSVLVSAPDMGELIEKLRRGRFERARLVQSARDDTVVLDDD